MGGDEQCFRFVHHMAKSTNRHEVIKLLEKLIAASPVDPKEIVVVLDNHGSHHSYDVRDFVAAKGITLLFLPAYSSTLNPIERLWSLVKHKWAKKLAALTVPYDKNCFNQDLTTIFAEAATQFSFRILNAADKSMRRALHYELV